MAKKKVPKKDSLVQELMAAVQKLNQRVGLLEGDEDGIALVKADIEVLYDKFNLINKRIDRIVSAIDRSKTIRGL